MSSDSIGYFMILPVCDKPTFRKINVTHPFKFVDSFDSGTQTDACGGYGISGDCPSASEIFGHLIDVNFKNCAEYWGELILPSGESTQHEVYYDLGGGFAAGEIRDVFSLSLYELNHLLLIIANRMLESVSINHRFKYVRPLAAQELLTPLEEKGIACYRCGAHFTQLSAYYQHECPELVTLNGLLFEVISAATNDEKKKTLEKFTRHIIDKTPGLSVTGVDLRGLDNEIDLKIANESEDPFLKILDTPILFECRNINAPIPAKAIRDFGGKLRDEGCKTGVFITRKGITGNERTDAKESIRTFRSRDKLNILALDDTDLILLRNGESLTKLLRLEFYGSPRELKKGMEMPKSKDDLSYRLQDFFKP